MAGSIPYGAEPSEPIRVAVLIASIGRESLVRTIHSVAEAALAAMPGIRTHVIVSDDSIDGAAAARLRDAGRLGVSLEVRSVAAQNISHARNAGLEAALDAGADYAAFIDDDEWAEKQWLLQHFDMARESGADAVVGRVDGHYPDKAPPWFVRMDPYSRLWGRHGADIAAGGAGNAFIRLDRVRTHGLRFDPQLGRSGGEDTDFFHRLRAVGGRVVATREAVVHEPAPLERCTLAFLKLRAVRSGQTYARLQLDGKRGLAPGGVVRRRLHQGDVVACDGLLHGFHQSGERRAVLHQVLVKHRQAARDVRS